MSWNITTKNNGKGKMYTAEVSHAKGYSPWGMTSDGKVITLFYMQDEEADEGTDVWELGVRFTDLQPERDIVVNAMVSTPGGVLTVEDTDRPRVRDGSGYV